MLHALHIFSILLLLAIPQANIHGETLNAGFVEGIWYATDPVFADIPNRVYVAFRNYAQDDFSATIYFADNGKRIGSSEVNALSGRLVEAWVDWTPAQGSHTLSVTLAHATTHGVGTTERTIDVSDFLVEDTISVAYDTDRDGIPNPEDTDDDNDGVSDTDESVRGSDPLVANPVTSQSPSTSEASAEKDAKYTKSSTDDTEKKVPTIASDQTEGLERFAGAGTIDTLLGNVTEKVGDARRSVDTYREARNEKLSLESFTTTDTSTSISEPSGTDTATITRTQIGTKNTLLKAFIEGVSGILQSIWTFVLWALSQALGHPALMQVFLLLGILYTFYRLMRRVGRRPNN
jgi:hypothetical protein